MSFQSEVAFNTAKLIDDGLILAARLSPFIYFKPLRIKKIYTGEIKKGDNVCIFIIYENYRIPDMTWAAIRNIKKLGIKLFIVVNSKLSEEETSEIQAIADISMFRNNVGKDFGAYKDAFLHLLNHGDLKKINRLIFANDSVIFPKKSISPIFEKLLKVPNSLVGYSHVQEIHYHIQSFLFSCDNKLFNHKLFINFWKTYLPIGRRRHMIHKGEVGLTKIVLKIGLTPSILNTVSEILNRQISITKLKEIVHSLPTQSLYRFDTLDSFKILTEKYFFTLANLLKDIRHVNSAPVYSHLRKDDKEYRKIIYDNFMLDLTKLLSMKNNTHWNTFIFLELGLPVVIKRDAMYRAGYDYDYFNYLIKKYLKDEHESIISMMKSPASSHYKGIAKTMFNHGMI